jgi:hypothetical protein
MLFGIYQCENKGPFFSHIDPSDAMHALAEQVIKWADQAPPFYYPAKESELDNPRVYWLRHKTIKGAEILAVSCFQSPLKSITSNPFGSFSTLLIGFSPFFKTPWSTRGRDPPSHAIAALHGTPWTLNQCSTRR